MTADLARNVETLTPDQALGPPRDLGPMTLEEFLELPEPEVRRLELLRGRVLETPRGGALHGVVLGNLLYACGDRVEKAIEGVALGPCGFVLREEPPSLLVPDFSFISAGKVAEHGLTDDVCRFPPDLAAEVLMPNDTYTTILDKVLVYLSVGTRLVWVVDPYVRRVTVHRPEGDARILTVDETLDGGGVLPGLEIPLAEVFE